MPLSAPVIRFTDGEILSGTGEVDLDRPDCHITVAEAPSNNKAAWVPFSAVKMAVLEKRDVEPGRADKKVCVRFNDGEILTGYLNGYMKRKAHGFEIELYTKDQTQVQKVCLPYSGVKAIFHLKDWTGRNAEDEAMPPLVELMGDIRGTDELYHRGAITFEERGKRRQELIGLI